MYGRLVRELNVRTVRVLSFLPSFVGAEQVPSLSSSVAVPVARRCRGWRFGGRDCIVVPCYVVS